MGTRSTYLWPSAEQIGELQALNLEGPANMLNLRRIKSEGGRQIYRTYGAAAALFLKKSGGDVKFWGLEATTEVVGESWDEIIMVKYSSVWEFLELFKNLDYPRQFRLDALLNSTLYCTQSST